jgi:2-polyprenyl-3-methyl-5-hydroxy-6-metoxy-1,4-benzoquinol methylase
MPTSQSCLYCSSPLFKRRLFATHEDERIFLFECAICKSQSLVPQPSDELLAEQYAGYYRKRVEGCTSPKSDYFAHIVRLITEHFPSPQQAVDLGAGEGFFAQEFLRYIPSATIDLVEQAGVPLVKQGTWQGRATEYQLSIEDWIIAPPKPLSYDVVIALDILEHLRDPANFLHKVFHNLLKPSGILVLTTPNSSSLSRRLFGRLWPHYKIEHLTYPTPKALHTVLATLPSTIIKLDPLTKQLPLKYCTNVLSNFGPAGSRFIGKVLRHILPGALSSQQVRFPTGESILLARKCANPG